MKLSIIIATYNRHQLLSHCLNSINNLDYNIKNKFKLDTYTKSSDSNKIINNYIEKKDCILDSSCLLF